MSNAGENFKGHFLTAMPDMTDPWFRQTVTCLCEHNEKRAMGLTIYRVFPDLRMADIFKDLKMTCPLQLVDRPVHMGGPVFQNEIFLLHGPPFDWRGSLQFTSELALTTTIDLIKAISAGTGPVDFLMVLGSAGWTGGQLEAEMQRNSWLTTPIKRQIVFDLPLDQRWKAAVAELGIDPLQLAHMAGNA